MLTVLESPPGLPDGFNRVRPFGINNSRAVVGAIYTSAGELPSRAFIHRGGTYIVLPLLDPTNAGGVAIGINDSCEVVGFDRTATGNTQGWLWRDGVFSTLPVPGTDTVAVGISSSGTVVGYRRVSFMRRLLAGQLRGPREMGFVLTGGRSQRINGPVHAINDVGVAAGASNPRNKLLTMWCRAEAVATVFTDGIGTKILSLPSAAFGINSAGAVIGSFAAESGSRAFIWSRKSGALDITPAGYRSAVPAAINERGDILGYGETSSGIARVFLLRPHLEGELQPQPLSRARLPVCPASAR